MESSKEYFLKLSEQEEATKKETERLLHIENDLKLCGTEEVLKDTYVNLSEQDKKHFSKLVKELKVKINK